MKFSSLFVPKYYLNALAMPGLFAKYHWQGWIFDNYFEYFYLDDCKFNIPKNLTSRLYRGARFINSNYEFDERKLLKNIDPKSTVLELVAGIGILSCIINKHLEGPSKHLVVEANPLLITSLKRNRDLNQAQFEFENVLVSNKKQFYLNDKAINASSAVKQQGKKISVPLANINQLQKNINLNLMF